jgi:CubicO group peptidase (beta-lactamase class C family)
MRKALGIAALLLARAVSAQGHVDPSQIEHQLRSVIPFGGHSDSTYDLLDRMRMYHVPGVSIAIVDGSRVVFERGYGVTDFGGSKAVDSTTLFLAGSISKPIFASGILNLVVQGKLSLDEDVNRRLTSWHLPESPFTATEKVTLRRILTHSAGLTVHGFPGYATDKPIPTVPQVLDGLPPANTPAVRNDTVPGARYSYSGGGITIAQLLATDVTREKFPELMQRLVLKPAGMTRSSYENPLPANRWPETAAGHEKIDTPVPGRWHIYPEMAAAGLWTTSADLARWSIALSDAYNGKSNRLMSTDMARQMVSHQVATQRGCPGAWGLGVAVDDITAPADAHFSHGGRDEGFVASLDMWPVRGQGIVILTNGVSGALIVEIQDAFRQMYGIGVSTADAAKRRAPVALDAGTLDRYVGRYQFGPNANVIAALTREGNTLYFQWLGQQKFELSPESDRIFAIGLTGKVNFEIDGGGRVAALTVGQIGCGPRAKKVD